MSIFYKQIQPIISYGCVNWALPSLSKYIYLDNVPNDITNDSIKNGLAAYGMTPILCKRVGKRLNPCRSVLLNMKSIDDKIKLLGLQNLCNIYDDVMVRNYDFDFDKLLYEKLHTRFCKFTMNVSKYSSNSACRAELGRYPLCYKMWNLSIQYWLRLENGTNNIILNMLINNCVKQEKHDWIQGIQYLLSLNGLGNIWLQPPWCNNSIIKSYGRIFSKRAEEQYIQKWDKNACYLTLHTYYRISTKHTHVQTTS